MSTTKRAAALFGALAAFALVTLGVGAPAGAAPGYTTQATVGVSNANPAVGATITLTGQNFGANETVNLTLHTATYNLGSAHTDASGSFSTSVTLPGGVSGSHTIVGTGATSGKSASVSICIGSCENAGGGGGGGGLSSTGVAVVGIASLGVVLLVGGGLLLLAGRRRNATVR